MEDVAREPGGVELLRRERRRDAAVGGERAVAVVSTIETTTPVAPSATGPTSSTPCARELPRDELARGVVAALRDAARLGSELRRPGRDVRRLAAGAGPVRGAHVAAGSERLLEPDDHVEQHVTERRDPQGTIVPWSRGEDRAARAVGLSARRRSSAPRPRSRLRAAAGWLRRLREERLERPAGLAAFEGAPCFEELLEQQRQRTDSRASWTFVCLRRSVRMLT